MKAQFSFVKKDLKPALAPVTEKKRIPPLG